LNESGQWLVAKELAKLLGVSHMAVLKQVNRRIFPSVKYKGRIFFNPEQVKFIQEWVKAHPPRGLEGRQRRKEMAERVERLKAKGIIKDADLKNVEWWLDTTPKWKGKKGGDNDDRKRGNAEY